MNQPIEETIGGVKASAPLWRGTDLMTLKWIVQLLSKASYHYADDSTGEWGSASLAMMEAAALINQHKLDLEAIQALYWEKSQLFPIGHLVNAVLKDARK